MGQVAVVVGGGQTLGAFLSQGLDHAGYRVAVADLHGEHAPRVAEELNEQGTGEVARGWQVDATNEQSVISLAQQVDKAWGRVGLQRRQVAEHGITVHSLMLGNLLKSPMFQSLLPQYAEKLGIPVEQSGSILY